MKRNSRLVGDFLPEDAAAVRRTAGLTLRALAEATGYTVPHLSQVFSRKRRASARLITALAGLGLRDRAEERARALLKAFDGDDGR